VLDSSKKDKIMKLVILCGQYSRWCSVSWKCKFSYCLSIYNMDQKVFKFPVSFTDIFGLRLQFCT